MGDSDAVQLERGQNLFEIHVRRIVLTTEALRRLGDEEPALFATWEFYEHEIQATPILKSSRCAAAGRPRVMWHGFG